MKQILLVIAVLSLMVVCATSQTHFPGSPQAQEPNDLRLTMPGSPFGIAAGFLYGYQGVKPYEFMPQLRSLGAGFTKIYLFWNQVEPQKGKYDWTAVDKFVDQLNSPDEGLLAIFSSSQWAVTRPAPLLPPSPAKNFDDYYRFVYDLVKHTRGRVRYWQNDCEPNNPIYWSGTKQEFVAELKVFYKAVKDADPSAVVVVGGYDGLFGPPGTHQFPGQQVGLDFFDSVLKDGRYAFDVFDLRLYGDPYTIVPRVEFIRQKMMTFGYEKPIICTEYGGPNLFEFPENRKYIPLVVSWSQSMTKPADSGSASESADKNQIKELYDNMGALAPQTQMFLQGCPPELNAKYQRIQSRGLVMRNLFALSAGVQKTLYWYLPAIPLRGEERYTTMALMYGKIGMLEVQDGALKRRYPTADAFERMAKALNDVKKVKRIETPDQPSIFLFEATRVKRGPVYVVWERRDAFTGEASPAVPFSFPWTTSRAAAVDVLGEVAPARVTAGRLDLSVSLTPIFVEPLK